MITIPFGKIASAGDRAANDDDITSTEEHRRKQDAPRKSDEDIRKRGPNTGGGNLRPSDRDSRQPQQQ